MRGWRAWRKRNSGMWKCTKCGLRIVDDHTILVYNTNLMCYARCTEMWTQFDLNIWHRWFGQIYCGRSMVGTTETYWRTASVLLVYLREAVYDRCWHIIVWDARTFLCIHVQSTRNGCIKCLSYVFGSHPVHHRKVHLRQHSEVCPPVWIFTGLCSRQLGQEASYFLKAAIVDTT
jgi:hypothetical protein